MNKASSSGGIPSSNNFTSTNIDDDDEDEFEVSSSAGFASSSYKSNSFSESSLLREEGKPSGLKNVGNTCWFNSIIQVVLHFLFLK